MHVKPLQKPFSKTMQRDYMTVFIKYMPQLIITGLTLLTAACNNTAQQPQPATHAQQANHTHITTLNDHTTANTATKKTPVVKSMSQAAVLKLLNNELTGFTLLDVRTPAEFARGHIQGAVNIPHHHILQNTRLLDTYQNTTLIIYCRSGRRASMVTAALAQQPHTKTLYHLAGDILAWKKSGLPLVTK